MCGTPSAVVRNRVRIFKVVNVSLGGVSAVFVGLRFLSRYLFGPRYSIAPDDWAVIAVAAVGVPAIVLNMAGLADHGLGRDAWTLSGGQVAAFMRHLFVLQILYLLLVMLVKLSFSLFYLDLFPGRAFRRMICATIVFHVSFCLAFVLLALFQCTPSSYYWERFGGGSHGHCVDINAAAWANAAINLVADVCLIAIPLCSLHRLELHWKRKLVAAVMFMTGFLVTIVSLLRLRSLLRFGNTANPTWDQQDAILWSTVEVNTGVICTCLPSVRLILAHVFPRTVGVHFGLPTREKPHLNRVNAAAAAAARPSRPVRTELEDIELDTSDFLHFMAIAKSIHPSEVSISVQTRGSDDFPRTYLSPTQPGGMI